MLSKSSSRIAASSLKNGPRKGRKREERESVSEQQHKKLEDRQLASLPFVDIKESLFLLLLLLLVLLLLLLLLRGLLSRIRTRDHCYYGDGGPASYYRVAYLFPPGQRLLSSSARARPRFGLASTSSRWRPLDKQRLRTRRPGGRSRSFGSDERTRRAVA